MQKTTDYSMFQFRHDNRTGISDKHVEKLKKSIKLNNLLEFRPMIVNQKMEVMDGQHRLMAAKELGVPIYFIKEDIEQKHLITLNTLKSWSLSDYLNFYVKNGYEEYIKFNQFLLKSGLKISAAMRLQANNSHGLEIFRNGSFKFNEFNTFDKFDRINNILNYIKSLKTYSSFLNSVRLYCALIQVVSHENYDEGKFLKNIARLIDKIEPKATHAGYVKLFAEIHNWKNHKRVSWTDEDEKGAND